MEELDEYVTVDAIHDECLNAAISFDAFDFENVTFEKPPFDSPAGASEDSVVSGVSEDSIRRWSIDDFVERYVAKIISDACETIKPKEIRPIRVSDGFAEKFIE